MKPLLRWILCAMLLLAPNRAQSIDSSTRAILAAPVASSHTKPIVEAHERRVAVLHVGDTSLGVGRITPNEDGDRMGGVAFSAGPDSVGFYDLASSTLKIVRVSGGAIRSVAGIPEMPWAGVRAPNGTFFLLVDRMQEADRSARFALYAMEPKGARWSLMLTFAIPGLRSNETDESIGLVASHGSEIDFVRSSGGGLTLVDSAGTVAPHPEVRPDIRLETLSLLEPLDGYRTSKGRILRTSPRTVAAILATDDAGYRYSEAWLGDLREVIDRFDPEGRLVASLLFERVGHAAIIRGHPFVIQPNGTIIRVQRTTDALIVTRASF